VWLPSWASIDGGDEGKLLTVAATKCLTECPAVYGNQPLWGEIKGALDGRLRGEPRARARGVGWGLARSRLWQGRRRCVSALALPSGGAPTASRPPPSLPPQPVPRPTLAGGTADGGAATPASVATASADDLFPDEDALTGGGGYAAAYARLANAAAPERPVLADIPDPGQYAANSLASFMSRVGAGAPA
jgi:hypothetical protein